VDVEKEPLVNHRVVYSAVALLVPTITNAQQPKTHISTSVVEAAHSITADDIRNRIEIIAHDSMRGRDTPSPELEVVAGYIGAQFRSFGLEAGSEDYGHVQHYPLQRVRLDLAASKIAVARGPIWHVGTEVVRHIGLTPESGVSGPTMVVSGRPDGQDALAGLPLAGAVVLVVTPLDQSTNTVVSGVLRHDPAAVVLVTPRPDPRWNAILRSQDRERSAKGWERAPPGAPVLEVRDSTLGPLLEAHGFDLAAARRRGDAPITATPLPGIALTITLNDRIVSEFTAPNVVGILEGSDPVLRDEYIVFSAHMDHVGVRRAVRGDSIYNGADDDASGTAAVIELAQAFAQLDARPRRSLIFLTVSGEEKGLWGSEYFTARPPVPIDAIVADLNLDMIGRNWRDTIVVIGKEHSDLGQTLARVNAAHPELDMTAIGDLWPHENFYRRSDHFNFAKKGVPILFFFNGTHEDYHRPSDEAAKIDAEKESRIVKLLFYLGLEIANAAERPQWNPDSYEQIVEAQSGHR
jgi:hypothetical protein